MAYSPRELAKFRQRIEQGLRRNPLWKVIANNSKWFCPYCAKEAVKRWPEDPNQQLSYVLKHLLKECPNWLEFRGKYKSIGELNRRKQNRELRTRVKRALAVRKEWQFAGLDHKWYCPFCVTATKAVIPPNRQMNEKTLTGIIDHVEGCYEYKRRKQKERSLRHIQVLVTQENKKKKICLKVRKALADEIPVWSQRNEHGEWICPYCHKEQQNLDISSPLARRENAPKQIADHLTGGLCKPYQEGGPPTMADADEESREISPLTSARPDPRKPSRPSKKTPKASQFKDPKSALRPLFDEDNENLPADGREDQMAAAKDDLTLETSNSQNNLELIKDPDFSTLLRASEASKKTSENLGLVFPPTLQDFEAELSSKPPSSTMPFDIEGHEAPDKADSTQLPKPSEFEPVPGFEFSFQLCHGLRGQHDFMDLVKVGPLRIYALGTVTQKNQEPQRIALLTRHLLRIHVRETTHASEILKLINNDIFEQLEPKTFISLILLVLDPRPGRIAFARAGLSSPLLIRPARRQFVRLQDCEGMPLGLDKGLNFDPTIATTHVQFEDNDLLLVPSDGVFEVRNRLREPWGHSRFEQLVNRYAFHEAEYFTDKLREKIELFARADDFNVDFSVVALKRQKKS